MTQNDFQPASPDFDRLSDGLKPMGETTAKDKRNSFIIATAIYAVLLVIMFFIRFWPPTEAEMAALIAGGGGGGGVTVNFGDSDFGSGTDFQSEALNVATTTQSTATAAPEESIIAEENNDENTSVFVPKNEPVKKPTTPSIQPVKTTKPIEVKQPVRKVDDALANLLKGNKKGGDGDDASGGNKGKSNGSLNSNGYYGEGGNGGGIGPGNGPGYSLTGRKALNKPQPKYTCNETGTVVVQITVDKNGTVIDAKPGARGTTNAASCLANQAKIAAMQTKWSPSPEGAERQVGKITYTFNLTE